MASSRLNMVDFLHFVYIYKLGLFTRKASPRKRFLTTLEPFDAISWFGFIFGSVLVGALAKVILWVFLPNFLQERIFSSPFIMLFEPFSITHNSWVTKISNTISGTILLYSWCFALLTFNLFYTSTLRSTLMTIRYVQPMDTVQGTTRGRQYILFLRYHIIHASNVT
jgi:hypothetical protein